METLSKIALGKIGETLVELELEKRNWIVFIPHYEEGIDFVAVILVAVKKPFTANLFRSNVRKDRGCRE